MSLTSNASQKQFADTLLTELVARILYRVRFASEQRPLEVASLAYLLPLALIILSQNGIEEQAEGEGEQVLLVLEFLSFHTGSCNCPSSLFPIDFQKLTYDQFPMSAFLELKF